MTMSDEALRSVAKLERSVVKRDVGVNDADWREFGYIIYRPRSGGSRNSGLPFYLV